MSVRVCVSTSREEKIGEKMPELFKSKFPSFYSTPWEKLLWLLSVHITKEKIIDEIDTTIQHHVLQDSILILDVFPDIPLKRVEILIQCRNSTFILLSQNKVFVAILGL